MFFKQGESESARNLFLFFLKKTTERHRGKSVTMVAAVVVVVRG